MMPPLAAAALHGVLFTVWLRSRLYDVGVTEVRQRRRRTVERAFVFVTGSIARMAKCRYLSYSAADFELLRPQGRHVAPMGVKFTPSVQR